MLKRCFDFFCSSLGLLLTSPILLSVMYKVWSEDKHSPFYIAPRVGRNGHLFPMIKMRSMVINADLKGGSSTSNTDQRVTSVGHFIRKYKIDEITQLWNVLLGDMSLVGPRPQVQSGVDMYTPKERGLLAVRPGITDFASIVFADEGSILSAYANPDEAYDQLIRPGKSALGLFYVDNQSFFVDIRLILLTILAIISREKALASVQSLLQKLGAKPNLIELAGRRTPLSPEGANN